MGRISSFLLVAAFGAVGSRGAQGQTPPAAQVQQTLAAQPELVVELKNKLAASGLTNDQIRARLKASGYPETLLDLYLPGSTGAAPLAPSDDAMAALRRLGLIEATAQAVQGAAADKTASAAQAVAEAAKPDAANEIFGLDMFRRASSQFDPATAGPVDATYRIGPKDVLVLILTGGVEASYTLEVTAEGFVVIPQVGQIFLANLTLDQIIDVLYTRLSRVYSGVRRSPDATTKFSVSVGRIRTNQIFVIGNVTVPGSYNVSGAGTMLTALYAAGGPSLNGSMRRIELRRSGATVSVLDIYDYIISGDARNDSRLQAGDVLFVPFPERHIRISGEVGRRGIYELKPGETLQHLIRYAGGLSPTAVRQRIQVQRIVPPAGRPALGGNDRIVIDVAMEGGGTIPPFNLEAGDRVEVFGVTDRVRNRIEVAGAVWAPGEQALQPGMRVSDALRAARGVQPDVYKDVVLVSRLEPDKKRIQLRTSLRDAAGTVLNDFLLQEDDRIHVFSESEFRHTRVITIAGAVRNSGDFDYREGMTLRDLVLLAGGFRDSSDVRNDLLVSRLQDDITRRQERYTLFDSSGRVRAFAVQPGDDIRLATYSQYRPDRYVAVTGAVGQGGQVPYREGMTLRDAVQLVGGLIQSAYLQEAEIARLPESRANGALAKTIRVPLDSTYLLERGPDGKYLGPPGLPAPSQLAPDVILKPYDNVLILRQPDWQLERKVKLGGEVMFPGEYTLLSRHERLADVVKRAGGLTAYAYVDGATFVRKEGGAGRVNISLAAALRNTRSRDNVVLFPGDEIAVPEFSPVVKVGGAVSSPATVAYRPGANLKYYLDAAGGALPTADLARSFVTQPNGTREVYKERWWLIPDGVPVPLAGADVVLPAKPEDKRDWITVAATLGQAIVSIAALLIIAIK